MTRTHRDPNSSPRTRLTRDVVLREAIALADADGIDALSMRRLALRLGVEAMSLYHHVASKSDLLGAMLDLVFVEIDLPQQDEAWKGALRATAVSAHRALLRHPWACNLLGSSTAPSEARLRWMDAVLGCLRGAGFSPDMTHHAYHALDSHIVGFTLWVLPYIALARERPDYATRFVERADLGDLPHLAEHIAVHLADDSEEGAEFAFGLDLILDGLDRMR